MSENNTNSHQCGICGNFVSETQVENHLWDEHAEEPEQIKTTYGEGMFERVFDENGNTESKLFIGESRECGICGEVIEPDDDHDRLTVGRAGIHLSQEHPDTDQNIFEVFGDPDVSDDADIETGDSSQSASQQSESTSQQAESTSKQAESTSKQAESTSKQAESTSKQAESTSKRAHSRSRQEISARGKFSVYGVGGAGNNILDSMLMRRDTLRDNNSRLAKAWEGGLQTYLPLNTNDSELSNTYYNHEDRSDTRTADVLTQTTIGDGSGAGEDPEIGLIRMKKDIENDETLRSWPVTSADLYSAQAHMFVHSVVKGTGSGATSALAQYIRGDVLDENPNNKDRTPLMAVTILPNEKATKFNPEATVNAGFGLGMVANAVDVLIPFDNERLGEVGKDIAPEINGLAQANPTYAQENRPLIHFLEAFMLSSNKEMWDSDATTQLASSTAGDDGFDVPDSFQPIQNRYPLKNNDKVRPATIACPLMAVSESTREVTENTLGILIDAAFNNGLLVNCEPETAWGGAFMFYGPEQPMKDVARHVRNYIPHQKIFDSLGTEELRVKCHQAVVPEADKLHLWGLLWNPKMPAMEQMWEKTKEAKQRNNDQAELLKTNWNQIKPVFQYLGRENRE